MNRRIYIYIYTWHNIIMINYQKKCLLLYRPRIPRVLTNPWLDQSKIRFGVALALALGSYLFFSNDMHDNYTKDMKKITGIEFKTNFV